MNYESMIGKRVTVGSATTITGRIGVLDSVRGNTCRVTYDNTGITGECRVHHIAEYDSNNRGEMECITIPLAEYELLTKVFNKFTEVEK